MAEIEKLKAETDKIKAETEKIRAEFQLEKSSSETKIRILLVILNTMYSEGMCKALAQSVDFVIGIVGVVTDKQASKFSAAFYEAVADNKDIKAAFEFAKASFNEKELIEQGDYQLFTFRSRSEEYHLFKI